IDWLQFTRDWRAGYWRLTKEIASGQSTGPTNVDEVHLLLLKDLLQRTEYQAVRAEWETDVSKLSTAVEAWHKLAGWPDSSSALASLHSQGYILSTLSNGSLRLLIDLCRYADLKFDVLLSGDLLKSYKPDPVMYERTCELLGYGNQREKVALVASHVYDVRKAREMGMKTVYIRRETEDTEYDRTKFLAKENGGEFDAVVNNLQELIDTLGRNHVK
ncbi:HAD-like protein, partial [Atractiella rhizophila]